MRTVILGDGFISSDAFSNAFTNLAQDGEVDLRRVEWSGGKAHHHHVQQVMEVQGANAVSTPPEILDAVGEAEILCLHFAPIGREVIERASHLRLVSVARAGLENVDLAAATERGIGVVPAFGRNAGAVAELQIGLMLAEARNIARADASIKSGGWRKEFPGARVEIAGHTVGMIGFGHVGRVFAQRLSGFAPTLLAYDPYASDADLSRHGVTRVATMDEVFSRSDFVVVMARHSPETDRFIGAAQLAQMKPSAYFINVSRSRLVDSDALLDALQRGVISGAGIDVFDEEPPAADSPWRALDNVTMTTHFGGDTEDTNRVSTEIVARNALEFIRTGKVSSAANAEALGWR